MWSMLLFLGFLAYALSLIWTKSKILGGKREFVEKEYQVAKQNAKREKRGVSFIHRWWRALWTCAMCCGFWMAMVTWVLPVPCPWPSVPWWLWTPACVLVVFGLNWLIHCVEDFLFSIARLAILIEKILKNGEKDDQPTL